MHRVSRILRRNPAARGLHRAIGAVIFACSSLVLAEEDNHEVEVTEQGGVYRIKASALIEAPAEYIRRVLSDFVHIYRLNPSIIESEVLDDEDEAGTYVRTVVLGCAGYFCKELERVEKVRRLPSGDLAAEIIPENSEFKSGRTLWHIEAMGERSRIVYEAEVEPDFYIPPVVGRFIAKKSIRTEIATSFSNLERIANVLAERDWITDFRLSSLQTASYQPCDLAVR